LYKLYFTKELAADTVDAMCCTIKPIIGRQRILRCCLTLTQYGLYVAAELDTSAREHYQVSGDNANNQLQHQQQHQAAVCSVSVSSLMMTSGPTAASACNTTPAAAYGGAQRYSSSTSSVVAAAGPPTNIAASPLGDRHAAAFAADKQAAAVSSREHCEHYHR